METELLNIRIPPDDMAELKKHADSLGLCPLMLGRFFIAASIRAVNDAGRASLPVNFQIVEPTTKTKK